MTADAIIRDKALRVAAGFHTEDDVQAALIAAAAWLQEKRGAVHAARCMFVYGEIIADTIPASKTPQWERRR